MICFSLGAIRGESFTRVPPTVGSGSTSLPGEPLECPPNVTGASDEPLSLSDLGPPLAADTAGRDDETDVLEKHYYRYYFFVLFNLNHTSSKFKASSLQHFI